MPKYIDARNQVSLSDLNRIEDLYKFKLNKPNIDFSRSDFFINYLDRLSIKYFVKRSDKNLPNVNYFSSKLQLSNNNFLFMKFLKFHLGYLSYLEAYAKNNLAKLEINNDMLETFIVKSFYNCLNTYKENYSTKISELNDFELISNVCVKERLTAYNFLLTLDRNQKEVKNFLNSEYISILRGMKRLPKFDKVYTNVKLHDVFEIYKSKDSSDNSI